MKSSSIALALLIFSTLTAVSTAANAVGPLVADNQSLTEHGNGRCRDEFPFPQECGPKD